MKSQPANGPRSAYSFGSGVTKQCVEAERLWTICLEAGIAYRDSEKMELISLMRRDPQFRSFEYDIKFARHYYASAKSALEDHLVNHGCWSQPVELIIGATRKSGADFNGQS
jgi:hypothetical protein